MFHPYGETPYREFAPGIRKYEGDLPESVKSRGSGSAKKGETSYLPWIIGAVVGIGVLAFVLKGKT